MMRGVRSAVAAVLFLAVPLILIVLALPRFLADLSVPQARAVTHDRLFSLAVHPVRLKQAETALSHAAAGDGDNTLWRAELLAVLAGGDSGRLAAARALTVEGLSESPANVRGWTLLCEIDVALKRADAPGCLDTAFFIGPFDWFVAQRRTALSIYLWPKLDADTQDAAARRLRLIWETPELRFIDFGIAKAANGGTALERAFADDPEMRASFAPALGQTP